MAKTQVVDVVVPEVYNPYVREKTVEKLNVMSSGIIQNSEELDTLAKGSGGGSINMPYWKGFNGADEVLSDTGALTPQKVTAGSDKAVLQMRGAAIAVNDLSIKLAGDDPSRELGDDSSEYWGHRGHDCMIASTKGVYASNVANNSGDMVVDISAEIGSAANFSIDGMIDASMTMGDSFGALSACMVDSSIFAVMRKANVIDYRPVGETQTIKPFFGDYRIIVNDNVVEDGVGNHIVTLFGQGAFGYGHGEPEVAIEDDRDALAGDNYVITRNHFILHPRGIKFTGANVAGLSPTNTEMEDATNWSRVYDRKNIPMAFFKCKIGQ